MFCPCFLGKYIDGRRVIRSELQWLIPYLLLGDVCAVALLTALDPVFLFDSRLSRLFKVNSCRKQRFPCITWWRFTVGQGSTFMTILVDGHHLFTSVAWDLAHEQLVIADASGVVQVWNTYTESVRS